jgi:thioesterase domain-containing protein
MSAAEDLEAFLHREIPLSKDMGVAVASLSGEALELSAPLEPNLNHKRTAFGGSLYSLAVLAAWGAVRGLLLKAGLSDCHVVIVEGNLSYLKPVDGPFRARCPGPGPEEAEAFRQGLERKGKARLSLECAVRAEGAGEGEGPAAVFKGVFAASRGAVAKGGAGRG